MTTIERILPVPPRVEPDGAYVIAMPVPNITGELHVGHAINLVVQDVLARHGRAAGRRVAFRPGVDHAGLSGQLAAERGLRAEGRSRQELGRDGFLAYMWSWHDRHQDVLLAQMRRLGIDADWDQPVSSVDGQRQELVREVFTGLWRRGLVYQKEALVNWCTACQTCIPDQEIKRVELTRTAYLLRVTDERGRSHTLSTLRPHLLLAASAVAAPPGHPALAASEIHVPVLDLKLPVRPGAGNRDRTLGEHLSAVVPCYNADDFDTAARDGTAVANLFAADGTLSVPDSEFDGLDPQACDQRLLERFTRSGVLRATEPYLHGDAYHSLCEARVTPRATPQWFIRVSGLRPQARWLLANPATRFNHRRWEERYRAVLEGTLAEDTATAPWWEGACLAFVRGFSSNQDWMISRQNWWGIPVPAWHCPGCRGTVVTAGTEIPHCDDCRRPMRPSQDVLDVLFHSALWAACVTTDTRRAYHADLAVIGHDILEFWIPIANLLSRELFDSISIRDVFVHGVITDDAGRKMSKSLGNVVVLDDLLAEYGTEATRALVLRLVHTAAGSDSVPLPASDPPRVAARVRRWERRCAAAAITTRSSPSVDRWLVRTRASVHAALADLDVGNAYRIVADLLDRVPGRLSVPQARRIADIVTPFHPGIADLLIRRVPG